MEKKSEKKNIVHKPMIFDAKVSIFVLLVNFVSDFTDAGSIFGYQVQIPISFTKLISIGVLNRYLIFERKKSSILCP